jgi:uncharacterized protein (TIGR02996 family)
MTPDNPFLQALLAEPDSDTLRLALADWLDEHDDAPRAESVRVQIELAHGGPSPERRRALEIRQSELLRAHDTEWVAPRARVLGLKQGQWGGWVFRRGFVEYFRLHGLTVEEHGARLAALTPVRELFVVGGAIVRAWAQPWVKNLTRVYELTVGPRVAEAMLASPQLKNLKVLAPTFTETDDNRVLFNRFRKRFVPKGAK